MKILKYINSKYNYNSIYVAGNFESKDDYFFSGIVVYSKAKEFLVGTKMTFCELEECKIVKLENILKEIGTEIKLNYLTYK